MNPVKKVKTSHKGKKKNQKSGLFDFIRNQL